MITSEYGKFKVNINLEDQIVMINTEDKNVFKKSGAVLSIDDFIDLVFVLTDSVFKTNDYASQRLIELLQGSFSENSNTSKDINDTAELMNTINCGTC